MPRSVQVVGSSPTRPISLYVIFPRKSMTPAELVQSQDFENLVRYFYRRRFAIKKGEYVPFDEYRSETISHIGAYTQELPSDIKITTIISKSIVWAMSRRRRFLDGNYINTGGYTKGIKHGGCVSYDEADAVDAKDCISTMLADAKLTKIERDILRMRFQENMTLHAIAETIQRSRERVNQRIQVICAKLRKTKAYAKIAVH